MQARRPLTNAARANSGGLGLGLRLGRCCFVRAWAAVEGGKGEEGKRRREPRPENEVTYGGKGREGRCREKEGERGKRRAIGGEVGLSSSSP